jgi:hypothetical protein
MPTSGCCFNNHVVSLDPGEAPRLTNKSLKGLPFLAPHQSVETRLLLPELLSQRFVKTRLPLLPYLVAGSVVAPLLAGMHPAIQEFATGAATQWRLLVTIKVREQRLATGTVALTLLGAGTTAPGVTHLRCADAMCVCMCVCVWGGGVSLQCPHRDNWRSRCNHCGCCCCCCKGCTCWLYCTLQHATHV